MREKDKQITVAELIAILQTFDKDLLVWAEGCDCVGEAVGAVVKNDSDGPYVLVIR